MPDATDPSHAATRLPGRADAARRLDALLLQVTARDQTAFAELFDAVAPRVLGLARRVLCDAHQAEEVTQEVLLQVWQRADQFDPDRGSALAWIMTLAHRRAVDQVRSSEAARRRDGSQSARAAEVSFDETAEAAHASLDAQRVRRALAALPVSQLEAIELAYFGGHTHREIAGLTRVQLGTAKSRIRDGLLRLQAALANPGPKPA